MQAPQAMHSYCRPLRISMPVGHTCTQIVQSMQSPRSRDSGLGTRDSVRSAEFARRFERDPSDRIDGCCCCCCCCCRSEEHTSELQSLMRNSYAVSCLKNKNTQQHSSSSTY